MRFAFLSISQSRHCPRRSTIQRPLCLQSISFTGFCEARERGISEPIRFSIEPGTSAVIFRTPNWEDFVHLAFSEIRFYGAEKMQIARRLRAMIVNLTDSCRRNVILPCAKNLSFWIVRSRGSTFYPRT